MKAAGITLSTVGAGGGANPFLEQLAQQGGGRFYAADQPGEHPRHLPQGDPAGLRPADRRGDVLPDPDLVVADPARPRRRAAAAPRLQRDDDQAGRPDRPGHRARRSAPRPVAVRPRAVGGLDVGLDRALGEGLGRLGRLQPVLQPARELDVPGRGDGRHRGDLRAGRRRDRAPRRERRARRLAARLLLDQRRRGRARPRAARPSTWSRSRPGVYEAPLGEIDPGAYAVRVTQTRPGSSPLGRTVGLVAPTAAEYRVLGANEPFLAALRAAGGGRAIVTPARPVAARPVGDGSLHRAVAAAADPGPAALAARHRPAAGVARAARAGRRARLGRRHRAAAPGDRRVGPRPARACSRLASGPARARRGRRSWRASDGDRARRQSDGAAGRRAPPVPPRRPHRAEPDCRQPAPTAPATGRGSARAGATPSSASATRSGGLASADRARQRSVRHAADDPRC